MQTTLLLDTRERELILRFPEAPVRALPVGDIWIGLSGEEIAPGGLVIERKAVADLEASCTDGRYREQRTRLLAYCSARQARAVYIVEGVLDRLNGKKTREELWTILNRLQMRYGVAVLRTETLDETARLLYVLKDQLTKDPTVFQGQQLSYSDVTSFTKRGNKEDPKQFALAVLQQCPGVSVNGAKALYESLGSLDAVWSATIETLQEVKVGNRRLGTAVAKRLHGLLHSI